MHIVSTNHGIFFYASHLGRRPITWRDIFDGPMAFESCQFGYLYKVGPMSFHTAFFVEEVSLSLDLGKCLIKIVSVTFSKMLVELVCICVRICEEGNLRFC